MVCYLIFRLPGLGSLNERPLQPGAAQPTVNSEDVYYALASSCVGRFTFMLDSHTVTECKGVTASPQLIAAQTPETKQDHISLNSSQSFTKGALNKQVLYFKPSVSSV